MDFFALFNIPVSFSLDEAALTSSYYKLSRQWHPDKFSLASSDEQAHAMQMTTDINDGYKTLKGEQSRLRYILELLGSAPEEGKESMPQEFLMEMMDINEAIMDYKMDPSEDARAAVHSQVLRIQAELEKRFGEALEDFDFKAPEAERVAAIKDYYLKTKYLNRLKDNVQDKDVEI